MYCYLVFKNQTLQYCDQHAQHKDGASWVNGMTSQIKICLRHWLHEWQSLLHWWVRNCNGICWDPECQVKALQTKHFLHLSDTPDMPDTTVTGRHQHYWCSCFPLSICIMLYPNVFCSFIPWYMLLWDHTDDRILAPSSFCLGGGLNVAPEALAQDAAWWLYLLFTGFQEVPEPPWGTSFNNLAGLTDFDVGKEGRVCSCGVFV